MIRITMDILRELSHLRSKNSFSNIKQSPSSQIKRYPKIELNNCEQLTQLELTNFEEEHFLDVTSKNQQHI